MTDPDAHTPSDPAGAPDVGTLEETVREAHSKAMEALAADVHPYSASAVSDWEATLDAALSDLAARARLADAWRKPFSTTMRAWHEADRLARRVAELEAALRVAEYSALKAAQLLPMTLSTSVERDHRDDHPSWAGWLLRHKVLPAIRAALAGDGDGAA